MPIDKFIAALVGIIGIAFTYWFFLMKKEKIVEVFDSVNITVDGGYSPSTISVPKGKTTKITFFRKDPSNCLEEVVLPDFKIREFLPLNKEITIEITPKKTGKFGFECGMGMFHGSLIVQ